MNRHNEEKYFITKFWTVRISPRSQEHNIMHLNMFFISTNPTHIFNENFRLITYTNNFKIL